MILRSLCLALLLAAPLYAGGPDKSGVKPNVLSLPTGAGSIEGLGESFEPQLNSGTGSYRVPLALPPGRAGFGPKLALGYSTGGGNSEFGIGWACSIPSITRQTDKGIPRYDDSDVFLLDGEELAQLSDATWRCENEERFTRLQRVGDGWLAEDRDGTRHEFGYTPDSRVRRGTADGFDETYSWRLTRSIDLNNNTIEYGYAAFEDSPGRLYLSTVSYNGGGYAVEFDYGATANSPQRHRGHGGGIAAWAPSWWTIARRHLPLLTGLPVPPTWQDSPLDSADRRPPTVDPTTPYSPLATHYSFATADTRPDALSDFRAGFHQRLGRRCREIRVFEGPVLARRYTLEYDADHELSLLAKVTVHGKDTTPETPDANKYLPPLTFDYTRMAEPDEAAARRVLNPPPFSLGDADTEVLDLNADGLPDIVHIEPGAAQYWLNLGAALDGTVSFADARPILGLPGGLRLSDPGLQFADFDGDSASDLVLYKGPGAGNLAIYPNPARGGVLSDGFARFGAERTYIGPAPFALGAANVQMQDLNFDKFIDVIVSDPFGYTAYLNNGGETWTDLGSVDFGSAAMANIPAGMGFDSPGVSLADMNGDRLQDLVRVQVDNGLVSVLYWHGRGNQRWDIARQMVGFAQGFSDRAEDIRIMDVNGDGLADMLALGSGLPNSRLRTWINRGNGEWGSATTWDENNSRLPALTAETILRTADMNGNGMADLVYANGTAIDFVDFSAGAAKPHMLVQVDNGIGRRVTIDYRSSIDHQIDARDTDNPWTTSLPFPVPVVTAITTQFGPFDLNEDGLDDAYRTSFRYRDAVYDPFEKEFRGFRYAEKIEWGDDYATLAWNQPWRVHPPVASIPSVRVGSARSVTLISRFAFHLGVADGLDNDETAPNGIIDERTLLGGAEEEALKGKPMWEEQVDGAILGDNAALPAEQRLIPGQFAPNAYTYKRTQYEYRIRRLHRLLDEQTDPDPAFGTRSINGRAVSFPFTLRVLSTEFEANGYLRTLFPNMLERAPTQTLVESAFDNYGNAIEEANWGLVLNNGIDDAAKEHADDERIVEREFIGSELDYAARTTWVVNRVKEERTVDEDGAFVSRSCTYYDGPDFVGLGHGQLGLRALPKRVEQFINGTAAPPNNSAPETRIGDARLAANESINASRTAYDAFGNAVAMLDPLGNLAHVSLVEGEYQSTSGHLRTIRYDSVHHTYPVRETIHLESPKPALAMEADYDTALGVMTSSTDFNGNVTTYGYDAYGRLTSIVKPGDDPLAPGTPLDTDGTPTQRFSYTAADPWTGTIYAYDRDGLLAPPSSGGESTIVNAVRTFLREDFSNADGAHTLDAVKYTDGLGRALLEAGEGELASERIDGEATGPVVAAAKRFHLRAGEYATQLPYFAPAVPPMGDVLDSWLPIPEDSSTSQTETFPDALGRPVRVKMPPESDAENAPRLSTLTFHLPRETWSMDEEQARDSGPRVGARMEHLKDGLDRLITVREVVKISDAGEPLANAATWTTSYKYDLQDNLVHITDSRNNTKWMRHDGLGRKVFMDDPDRGTMDYTYDAAANLIETRDAKLQRIAYAYDGANRLLSEDYDDAGQPFSAARTPDVLYHYDAWTTVDPGDGTGAALAPQNLKGMLAAIDDLTGGEYFSYDARGRTAWRVKAVDDPQNGPRTPYLFRFRYDAMDRLRDIVYPDNDAVRYEYNSRGEIERIVGGLVGEAAGRTILDKHDSIASGQKLAAILGNGIESRREYDPRLRMTRLRHSHPQIAQISQMKDPRANSAFTRMDVAEAEQKQLAQIVHTPNTVISRAGAAPSTVKSAESVDDLVHYAYAFDGASNILSITDLRPTSAIPADSPRRNTQHFEYDDLYRLTAVEYPRAGDQDRIDYRYDPIGNMVSMRVPASGLGNWTLEEDGKSIIHMGAMSYGEAAAGQTGPTGTQNRAGRSQNGAAGPHALTSTESGRVFEYDANGNMRRIEDDAATWDFKDRLHRLVNEKRQADYRYDYADRRITKLVRALKISDGTIDTDQIATTTLYVDRLFELREGDNPIKYVFHGEERIVRATGGLAPARERVQRLRFSAGYNFATPVVMPAGGYTASAVFGLGEAASPVDEVARYVPGTNTYVALSPADAVTPGTGYRIHSAAPWSRAIRGAYTDIAAAIPPPNVPIPASAPDGLDLIGWPRLEPLDLSAISGAVSQIHSWDPSQQAWRTLRATGVPPFAHTPRPAIATGRAFITRSDAATAIVAASAKSKAQGLLWLLPDHLGTHQTVTDAEGELVSETVNLPYGSERSRFEGGTGGGVGGGVNGKLAVGLGYRFTGKEKDDESGLMYFEARYKLSVLPCFISVDPIHGGVHRMSSPSRLNNYSYCRLSPMLLIDYTGKDFFLYFYSSKQTSSGAGHVAIGVETHNPQKPGEQKFFESAPTESTWKAPRVPTGATGSRDQVITSGHTVNGSGEHQKPLIIVKFRTAIETDKKMTATLEKDFAENKDWIVFSTNCADTVKRAMKQSNVSGGKAGISTPQELAQDVAENNSKLFTGDSVEIWKLSSDGKTYELGTVEDLRAYGAESSFAGVASQSAKDTSKKVEDKVGGVIQDIRNALP